MEKTTLEQLDFILQFIHLEKLLADFPGITDENMAAIFGIDGAQYRSTRNKFNENARKTAEVLLTAPEFADLVDRLPFSANSTVLAVGDSITDDHQSWLEILRHLVNLRRPGAGINIINAGVSGDTTTHAISRFPQLMQVRPDWVLFMIGLNDARQHGITSGKTLVSIEETGKNLHELRRFAVTQISAELVWMTPPAVIEEKISEFRLFKVSQTRWANTDVSAVARLIKQLPDRIVDVHAVFGLPPDAELLLDDGLHPSLHGQAAIVRVLLESLAQGQA